LPRPIWRESVPSSAIRPRHWHRYAATGALPRDVAKVAPGDRFGLGLLSHRVPTWNMPCGRRCGAADFRRALLVNLAEGSPQCHINLRNWGELLDPQGSGVADDFLRRRRK